MLNSLKQFLEETNELANLLRRKAEGSFKCFDTLIQEKIKCISNSSF